MPGRNAFVESPIIASTPSSPSRCRAASSEVEPTKGSGSNFQSPVCSTVPTGVRSATALGSGIECVSVINSRSNGPIVNRPDIGTTLIRTLSAIPASTSFARSSEAVNGVAHTGQRSCVHK